MKQNNIFNSDTLFEQMTAISKAGAYDAIAPDYAKVKEENIQLKARVKYLEDLIIDYTDKMIANIEGIKNEDDIKDIL